MHGSAQMKLTKTYEMQFTCKSLILIVVFLGKLQSLDGTRNLFTHVILIFINVNLLNAACLYT